MTIKIKIENCETIADFYAHTTELRKQIKREAKRLKLSPADDSFSKKSNESFKDFNCYGEHYVSISN